MPSPPPLRAQRLHQGHVPAPHARTRRCCLWACTSGQAWRPISSSPPPSWALWTPPSSAPRWTRWTSKAPFPTWSPGDDVINHHTLQARATCHVGCYNRSAHALAKGKQLLSGPELGRGGTGGLPWQTPVWFIDNCGPLCMHGMRTALGQQPHACRLQGPGMPRGAQTHAAVHRHDRPDLIC